MKQENQATEPSAAGYWPDPHDPVNTVRYFDGDSWTASTKPADSHTPKVAPNDPKPSAPGLPPKAPDMTPGPNGETPMFAPITKTQEPEKKKAKKPATEQKPKPAAKKPPKPSTPMFSGDWAKPQDTQSTPEKPAEGEKPVAPPAFTAPPSFATPTTNEGESPKAEPDTPVAPPSETPAKAPMFTPQMQSTPDTQPAEAPTGQAGHTVETAQQALIREVLAAHPGAAEADTNKSYTLAHEDGSPADGVPKTLVESLKTAVSSEGKPTPVGIRIMFVDGAAKFKYSYGKQKDTTEGNTAEPRKKLTDRLPSFDLSGSARTWIIVGLTCFVVLTAGALTPTPDKSVPMDDSCSAITEHLNQPVMTPELQQTLSAQVSTGKTSEAFNNAAQQAVDTNSTAPLQGLCTTD